ncbi:MAG: DinB family protein [Flavitalea sp.]
MKILRPAVSEYTDFYLKYIDLVQDEELVTALEKNGHDVVRVFSDVPAEIEVFRYDTNKWSIKEVLMHIIDFERYFTFKAFVSMRNDLDTIIYHPKRDHYLFNSATEHRHLNDLLPEFTAVRSATISLYRNACEAQLKQAVKHENEAHVLSARALGFALTGHAIHHLNVIRERYLGKAK